MHRLILTVLASVVVLVPAFAQRNVLVVVIDDLGVENLAAYGLGSNPPPTPNIDALARNGVVFRNAWSNTVCSPARAMLLTGRYGFRTGVQNTVPQGPDLPPREVTIAEHLRASGAPHACGLFGKWHLSTVSRGPTAPNDAGFQRFAGMFYGVGDYLSWDRLVDGVTTRNTNYATSQNVDDALAWIGAQPGPWACYFTPISVHAPFHAPPSHLHTQSLAGLDPNTDPVPFYRAMIEALDTEIGRLLQGLGPARANTQVIVLGDNGTPPEVAVAPVLPSHGKGSPYEGGIRVPLIVSGPDVVQPGRNVDAIVSVVDLFATVAETAGAGPSPLFVRSDSVSLLPYLGDPNQAPLRETVFSEFSHFDPVANQSCGFAAIRDSQYKLIRRLCSRNAIQEELYDLANDPFEAVDLIRSNMGAAVYARLVTLETALDELQLVAPAMSIYGSGACVGSFGSPRIRGVGTPRLGNWYGVLLTGAPPSTLAVLSHGGSDRSASGVPLPFSLSALGGGVGCDVLASTEIVVMVPVGPFGSGGLAIPVPNDPMLAGAYFRHQWFVLDPAANSLGLTTTAGLCVTLGR